MGLVGAIPPGMVRVPGGAFVMGGGDQADERPAHRVRLSTFFIDRSEVTRAAYGACVRAGACAAHEPSQEPGNWPMIGVSWLDAVAYCRYEGKRLPTEAEWEKAARGTDRRIYPWGNSPSCDRANFGNYAGEGRCPKNPGHPVAVGSYPRGDSPYGAHDLAGNVWEWVADSYDPTYYRHSPAVNPEGPRGARRRKVVRGGACCSMFGLPRSSNRLAFPATYRDDDIGFRCARSAAH